MDDDELDLFAIAAVTATYNTLFRTQNKRLVLFSSACSCQWEICCHSEISGNR